jgi:hypothetical protein
MGSVIRPVAGTLHCPAEERNLLGRIDWQEQDLLVLQSKAPMDIILVCTMSRLQCPVA